MHISIIDSGLVVSRQTWNALWVPARSDHASEILHGAERRARRPKVGPEDLVTSRITQKEIPVCGLAQISARPKLLVDSFRHEAILLEHRRNAALAAVAI